MAHPTRTDRLPESPVINTQIPPQPQKGTWFTLGIRVVCTLTGAAIGTKGGRDVGAIYAQTIRKSSSVLHPASSVGLAVLMANVVMGGVILGTSVGAIAGYCAANRILASPGLHISS